MKQPLSYKLLTFTTILRYLQSPSYDRITKDLQLPHALEVSSRRIEAFKFDNFRPFPSSGNSHFQIETW